MNVALQRPMTLDAFLAWEREQDRPYEFDGFGVVPMNGGTINHAAICFNIGLALDRLLADPPYRFLQTGVKIVVAGRVRYPDGLIARGAMDGNADVVAEPVVVFEVLSPSTSRTDRIAKTEEYRQTPSIQHYVILEQGSQAATVFTRSGADWSGRVLAGEVVLRLPAVGVDVPLAALYAKVTFTGAAEG